MNMMLDIQQKRKLRAFLYSKVTLTVLFVLVVLSVHSTWVVYEKKRESENLMNISKQRVDELKMREDDLNYKIQRLDTEVGLEEEIRSKFSVVKEGEQMIVVVPNSESPSTTTSKKLSFWQKMFNYFK